ncbi:facilitated trehalose transporter Tret1-like [Scaptodrosophila lebanonensis]|uniref:Facilitated trehalose transporter Tret1-like n=1 Tax=Drosophila lebanonensis TaxID=7225 RepID=A0A6J2UBG2_DROLE|nr:facilitated trehalose transporter Tret1-like [Scaptodrosophila lebanonensis]
MLFDLRKCFQSPDSLLNSRHRYQLLVTLLVNIMTFSHGLGVGWMSPVMRKLQTDDTPLSFRAVIEEVSWIGSLLGIGSVIGNIAAGVLQNRVGRKPVMFAIAIPHSCFWLLSYFAQSVEYFYVGRLLAGISGGGGYIVLPLFISEISDTNIRGTLSSTILLSVNMGVLSGYIISIYAPYYIVPFCVLALPTCYFICNLFLPETPHHLIQKGRYAAAERSFRFYKNIRASDVNGLNEFDDLRTKLTKEQSLEDKTLTYKDFVTKPAIKAYGSAVVLLMANQLSGLFCFTNYMTDIFAASHSSLDVNICTIVVGAVQILGNYMATLLCDKYGRKILLLVSSLGSAICLGAFGTYTYFASNPNNDVSAVGWLPLLLLSLVIFIGNIGLVGCFFVVMVELLPAKIRSVALPFFIVQLSILIFVSLKIFPVLMVQLGISVTMWCCGGMTFLAFLYFSRFLEETKGKSLLDS